MVSGKHRNRQQRALDQDPGSGCIAVDQAGGRHDDKPDEHGKSGQQQDGLARHGIFSRPGEQQGPAGHQRCADSHGKPQRQIRLQLRLAG